MSDAAEVRSGATLAQASETGLERWAARWFPPALVAVTAAALAGRLTHLIRSRVDDASLFTQGDAFWYGPVAGNLADGNFFRNAITGAATADHPPVTVLVLTPASLIWDNTLAQRLTMVGLGTLTVAVIGLLGRRLAGPVAGLVAAACAAVLPSLWVNDVLLMSETPTALLVALTLWAGVGLAERPGRRWAIAAGALCGLAALTRAETGLFLPLMVWPLLARAKGAGGASRSWRERIGWIAAATLAAALVMAPWIGLNLTRFSDPVAISTNEGLVLAGANCDATYDGPIKGAWTIDPCLTDFYAELESTKTGPVAPPDAVLPCPDQLQRRQPCLDFSQVTSEGRDHSLAYVRGHLSEVPGVVWARHGRTWGWKGLGQAGAGVQEGRGPTVSKLAFYTLWVSLPLAAYGAWVLRRRGTSLVPFGATLVMVLVVTTLFFGLARFRLPFDVASCVLVGVAVSALVRRWHERRGTTVEGAGP